MDDHVYQVEHEHWWDTYKFFNQRSRAIMSDWARDRQELMEKARSVFMEACVAHELEEVKLEYTKRHEAFRDALYNQVRLESFWVRFWKNCMHLVLVICIDRLTVPIWYLIDMIRKKYCENPTNKHYF